MLHLVAWIASCVLRLRAIVVLHLVAFLPLVTFSVRLPDAPGKPMDVPVQLKQYKGQEDEVYDKALQRR